MYTPNEDVYVTWTAPKFTDNSGKSIPSDPSRSSTYPVGTTTISYSATDDAGLTTTCSFNITVISKYPYGPRSVIKYFGKIFSSPCILCSFLCPYYPCSSFDFVKSEHPSLKSLYTQ